MPDLAAEFQMEMFQIYETGKSELGYTATYFLNLLNDLGGVAAAKRLLAADKPQYGFSHLWERGRLDLSVECLVLKKRYQSEFEPDELDEARRRLRAHRFDSAQCET